MKTDSKALLFLQFGLSILIVILTALMAAAAIVKNAFILWKVYTLLLVIFGIFLVKHLYKELKNYDNERIN